MHVSLFTHTVEVSINKHIKKNVVLTMIDSSDAHLEEAQGSSETISIPLVTQEAENMASQNEEQKVNEEQENGDDFVNKGKFGVEL
jgi:protein required for attachment to host cells